jgi:hypothetical protein
VVTNACGCKDSCDIAFGCRNPFWGCTLGFWKTHTAIWDNASDPISACVAAGISGMGGLYSGDGTAGSSFMTTFGLTPAEMGAAGFPTTLTLLQALNLGGGKFELCARSGVAALLNSCGLFGHFYYNLPSQVLIRVHDAIASGDPVNANAAGVDFQLHNETQPDACPPGGRAGNPKRTVVHTAFGTASGDDAISISAYPNPFSSAATIEFTLMNTSNVSVEVFDLNGKKVADLYKGVADADISYQVQFSGSEIPAGIYIYRITAGDRVYNDRIILIK